MSTITISQFMPSTGVRKAVITAQWAGKGLAVHEEVFIHEDGSAQLTGTPDKWALTCVNTGRAAGFFSGDLQKAITLAQEWDKDFAEVSEEVPQRLRLDFRVAIYHAKVRGEA